MIIGLEGVSCVGKTTLATALATRLDAVTVECYYHAAPDPSWLPQPTAASAADQLDNLTMLMRVEALRRAKAVAASAAGWDVILDRTVDTLLAHAHAIGRLHGFDCDAAARTLVQAHPIVVPDVTLLLHADHAVLAARAARRVGMPAIFYDARFAAHFTDHFDRPLTPHCIPLRSDTGPGALVEHACAALAHHRSCTSRRAA